MRSYRPALEYLEERCLLSGGYAPVNLASDVPGLARVTDPNLVNPWGISFSPTGPFWFADNGRGVSDLLDGRGRPLPLVVTVPSATGPRGTPTGTVFNGTDGFAPFNVRNIDDLLFVTYARQGREEGEAGAGPGQGFIDVYDAGGGLVRRFASRGALDAPWGLAPAPAGFGPFGGALLVGNNG